MPAPICWELPTSLGSNPVTPRIEVTEPTHLLGDNAVLPIMPSRATTVVNT
jgi:hypothetical protein